MRHGQREPCEMGSLGRSLGGKRLSSGRLGQYATAHRNAPQSKQGNPLKSLAASIQRATSVTRSFRLRSGHERGRPAGTCRPLACTLRSGVTKRRRRSRVGCSGKARAELQVLLCRGICARKPVASTGSPQTVHVLSLFECKNQAGPYLKLRSRRLRTAIRLILSVDSGSTARVDRLSTGGGLTHC